MQQFNTLQSVTHVRSTATLCLLVKSALFSTNLDPKKKIDLTKYVAIQDFMISSCLCEVWYDNSSVDSGQNV